MRLFIVPAALDELRDAAAFYTASANAELGLAFVAEFERAANAVLTNPRIGARFRGTRRRYFLRRFPYSLIYHSTGDEIRIIAVAHQRRRPTYCTTPITTLPTPVSKQTSDRLEQNIKRCLGELDY